MSILEIPGARLYYELHGNGPLLILVPGAGGSAEAFGPLTDHLASDYAVLRYDRRGFSRSTLTQPPADGRARLGSDADDVRQLIAQVDRGPALVFGASSGALVALAALAAHPDAVGTVVAFEPPAMSLLEDAEDWLAFFARVYDLYRTDGTEVALAAFRDRTFPAVDRRAMRGAPRNDANAAFWFEHELRQYPALDINVEALTRLSRRIIPAVGADSDGYPCSRATHGLARRLGREVVTLPGGHVGFVSAPVPFAAALRTALPSTEGVARSSPVAAEASIAVSDPARYITQLCRHAEQVRSRGSHLGAHREVHAGRPKVTTVERSQDQGRIHFDQGVCIVKADRGRLTIHVEGIDTAGLRRIKDIVQADLERFGGREGLQVIWDGPSGQDQI